MSTEKHVWYRWSGGDWDFAITRYVGVGCVNENAVDRPEFTPGTSYSSWLAVRWVAIQYLKMVLASHAYDPEVARADTDGENATGWPAVVVAQNDRTTAEIRDYTQGILDDILNPETEDEAKGFGAFEELRRRRFHTQDCDVQQTVVCRKRG